MLFGAFWGADSEPPPVRADFRKKFARWFPADRKGEGC